MSHTLLVAAPVICFLLLVTFRYQGGCILAKSVLECALTLGVMVTVTTEVLGYFHQLTHVALVILWITAATVAGVLALSRSHENSVPLARLGLARSAARFVIFKNPVLLCIGAIAFVTLFTGLVSAPNNFDSMTYHLTRVVHWMKDRSVAHYPCNFRPQLYHPPFAEFAILHLQLLSGGDRFASCVQWAATMGCGVGVAGIVSQIGGSKTARYFAALFVLTLPSRILQSVSTQNNYVLAFWLVNFIYSTVELQNRSLPGWVRPSLSAGCSLGLALLTKSTAYVFVIPFLVWLGVVATRTGLARGLKILAVVASMAVFLNLGHWVRNYQWFGSIFMPRDEANLYHVQAMSVPLWLANMMRNITCHLLLPNDLWVRRVQPLFNQVQSWLGVGPSDTRITFPGHIFQISKLTVHEDFAGNPLHFIVILCVAALAAFSWLSRFFAGEKKQANIHKPHAGLFLMLSGCSFALFCMVVNWLEFNGRLHLPLFVIAGVPVAIVFSQSEARRMIPITCIILTMASLPYLFTNPNHPWFGKNSVFRLSREEQYFINNPSLFSSFRQAADLLGAKEDDRPIGVAVTNQWEYPLWVMLRTRTGHWPMIQSVPGLPVPNGIAAPDTASMRAIIVSDLLLATALSKTLGAETNVKSLGRVMVVEPSQAKRSKTQIISR